MRLVWTAALLGLAGAALTGCSGGTPGTARLARLEVTHPNVSIAAGRTESFQASAIYDDGSTQDVTGSVTWSSSLPWVATVDAAGIATSYHAGTVDIVADLGNLTASAPLVVTEPVADQIQVEPAGRAIPTGSTVQYDAYAAFSDGSERKVTAFAVWSSSNETVASVSSAGVVSGQVSGTAQILAAYGGAQGQTLVTVYPSVIFGGGDMLAARAYVGYRWFNENDPDASRRLSNPTNPPDDDSLFGIFSAEDSGPEGPNPQISYCQSGDSVGKALFVGLDGARVEDECGDYSVQSQGFSGLLLPPGPTDPDFVAAELPLNGEEYIRFLENKGVKGGAPPPPQTARGPVQFPALAASIAIAYNNLDIAPDTPLNLRSEQLCGIFSGAITNWDQLDQFDPRLPSKAIRVVYRGDRSAATFALTNHMSFLQSAGRRCAGFTFKTVPLFTSAVPATLPPGAVSAGSNAALGSTVEDPLMDGAIGYGEAADLRLRYPEATYPRLRFANVNGFDPLRGLASPVITTFAAACVIEPRTAGGTGCAAAAGVGRPVVGQPDFNTGAANPCAILVTPDSYADPSSAPAPATPGYPILSVSYLLAYSAGNGTAAPAIERALLAPYQATNLPDGFVRLSGYSPPTNCVGQ